MTRGNCNVSTHSPPAGDAALLGAHHPALNLQPLEMSDDLGDGEEGVDRAEVREKCATDFMYGKGVVTQHFQHMAGALLVESQPLTDEGAVVSDDRPVARQCQHDVEFGHALQLRHVLHQPARPLGLARCRWLDERVGGDVAQQVIAGR